MYLVDTSVWINFLRQRHTESVNKLYTMLDRKIIHGITGVIFQEILQGANSQKDYNQLVNTFETQRFFHPQHAVHSYQEAANLYHYCRRAGITIRSSIDCFIAQIAIEHDLLLLHDDQDFVKLHQVNAKLRLAEAEPSF